MLTQYKLPKTLAGQMIALMFVSLLITQWVSIRIYIQDREEVAGQVSIYGALRRIESVVILLNQADHVDFKRLKKAISSSDMTFSVDNKPTVTQISNNPQAMLLAVRTAKRLHLPVSAIRVRIEQEATHRRKKHHVPRHQSVKQKRYHFRSVHISIPLLGGRWLNTDVNSHDEIPDFAWRSAKFLFALGILALALMIFLIRRATRPLQRLADAAVHFGRNMQTPTPVPVAGPLELRETIQAFNQMQDRLQRFIQDRTLMLAAISHDLRTPLTSLRLRAEFLPDEPFREKLLETLQHMEIMLQSTLDFSRDDNQQEALRRLDLGSLVQSLCDDMSDLGQPVHCDLEQKIITECRPTALRRALTNLITNGIKYGQSVRVSVQATTEYLQISVKDQGPGIDPALHEQVFTPFYRIDKARPADSSVGLGMSVARTIVRAHGGYIMLDNPPEGGLRVRVRLPR